MSLNRNVEVLWTVLLWPLCLIFQFWETLIAVEVTETNTSKEEIRLKKTPEDSAVLCKREKMQGNVCFNLMNHITL